MKNIESTHPADPRLSSWSRYKSRLKYLSKKHILRHEVTSVSRFNFQPLSHSPKIALLYTPSGLDHLADAARRIPPEQVCHFLILFNWYMDPVKIEAFTRQATRIRRRFPNVHLHVLCNSLHEWREFRGRARSLPVHFVNQNIMLDEEVYTVDPRARKVHDAVYNARMAPYKRFELASEVDRLAIITCGWKTLDRTYFDRIRGLLADATWHNLGDDGEFRNLPPERVTARVNEARVGLILSHTEGACFAATEYLLCGLPVVSTRSRGGREAFFTDETAVIVDGTSEAVRDGVHELLRRRLRPEDVRGATLGILAEHRARLFDVVNGIYRESGHRRDFSDEWKGAFRNKMLTFTDGDAFSSFVRP